MHPEPSTSAIARIVPSLVRCRWPATLVLAAALSACGGGSGPTAPEAASAAAEADQPRSNRILDAGAATVRGATPSDTAAYLAWSKRVKRISGAGSSANFAVDAPHDGYYELFAWWPQGLVDAGRVRITVAAGSRSETVTVDQRQDGGRWVSLGYHALDRGRGAAVSISGVDGAFYVDALRAEYAGTTPPALQWRSEGLAVGLTGERYESPLRAAGGTPPYVYRAEGALPPGIAFDERAGLFAGQPTAAGTFPLAVEVRDARGAVVRSALDLVVEETGARAPTRRALAAKARPRARDAAGQTTGDLSNLLSVVAAMPEGGWARVNLNSYSDVWTPASLRPLYGSTSNPTPSKIILAWSSFTWDSNRGQLLLYGGGHANYRGNDVYAWNGSTRLWERAALPSQMVQDARGNWVAVDGYDKAPASAHTYDNTMFFPLLDRMVVLGGAADSNGGHYLTAISDTASRSTGPYFFDPSRADGSKVGGTTGSHVQRVSPYPDIVGGSMWSNRDAWLHAGAGSSPPSDSFVNGCTGVTVENGRDVAYVRTRYRVYRYEVPSLADPAADSWQLVGRYYSGSGAQATCTYDHQRRALVVAERNARPFLYWDMSKAGKTNNEVYVVPQDPTGEFPTLLSSNAIDLRFCGIEYDPRRDQHMLWCGDGRVWSLKPPATLSASGWVIRKADAPATEVPPGGTGTGILGKWKYIPNLDVFMGLQDATQGNIWIYKPVGWVNPSGGNLPPSVSLDQPADGTTVPVGTTIALSASAADADGSVALVEFYADGVKIGQAASPPYTMSVTPDAPGTWSLTAVATDDDGARTTSIPATVTVESVAPPNQPPAVALTQPAPDASFVQGTPIRLEAAVSDSDGSVVKVEFYAGVVKIGESTQAPFRFDWAGAATGSHSVTARAIDDDGAATLSAAVVVTVTPLPGGGDTVTLQRGSGAVVADTYLSSYHKTTVFGGSATASEQKLYYGLLVRFAIFQSEGGPVPNGAQIDAARLSLYKSTAYDMVYALHPLLQPWTEAGATWNQRQPGAAWTVPGASGAGSDHGATADATAAIGWDPGWLEFDVTARVAAMSAQPVPVNHGWRLIQVSGYVSALKKFHLSEYAVDPSLRPKLVVTWR